MKKIHLTWLLICALASIGFAQPGLPLETALEETKALTSPSFQQKPSWPIPTTPTTIVAYSPVLQAQDLQLPQYFDPPELRNNTIRTLVPYAISALTPLGLFCNVELEIEKIANFPVRIRLGEVDYTERLEYGEHFRLGRTDFVPQSFD